MAKNILKHKENFLLLNVLLVVKLQQSERLQNENKNKVS
jgi:hypothetical protein